MKLEDLYKKVFTHRIRLCKSDLLFIEINVTKYNADMCTIILKQSLSLGRKNRLSVVK